jgi:hypothetical protein
MENGYNVWSFNGKLIHKVIKDRFFQFLWRPRPPTLLTKEKQEVKISIYYLFINLISIYLLHSKAFERIFIPI